MLTDSSLLNKISIVLIRPKYPENIGAAARSAFNMGLSKLVIVRDCLPERAAMAKMATHKAAHLVDGMKVYDNVADALAPFSYIVGTTARRGRQRGLERTPRQVVSDMAELLANNEIALVFGPEDCGLTNEELQYCHATSTIPTADFASLNLAQAVAIHCYELHYGLVHEKKEITPVPQRATSFELEGMFSHVEEALIKINFLEKNNHDYWMNNIRRFFSRMQLTSRESNIVRGICRQFMWYQDQRDNDTPT